MIKTAVILAAGMGSRIRGVHGRTPKGFITLGSRTLIEESILRLHAHGILTVVIGTGFACEMYEELGKRLPGVTCMHNPDFATTGSMATLRRVSSVVQSDILLLESDLIYEADALTRLLDAPERDVILTSDVTDYGDEVYVSVTPERMLANMSKRISDLKAVDSVLVGISKCSAVTLGLMNDHFDRSVDPGMNYEDALVGIAPYTPVSILNAGALLWSEIDTPEHLDRARTVIFPAIQEREYRPRVRRNVLLNPGPATTTDTVKYSQVVPDICPREKEFTEMLGGIREQLTELVAVRPTYDTVLFGGSGTAAVEAMLSSVIGNEDILCVVNNGAYGARMSEIGHIYRLPMMEFTSDPLRAVDLDDLARAIDAAHPRVTHLAIVHHETTSGLLNNLDSIGRLCSECGITLMVDAISSCGAIPIDMAAQGIHFLAGTGNKNIQGMPGVCFVVANTAVLEKSANLEPRNLYLNLFREYAHVRSTGQTRFTPPVQTCYALRQALREILLEGVQARYERYTACWQVLVEGLSRLGLQLPVAPAHQSRLLTTVTEPVLSGYSFESMHDELLRKGFTIYPGKLLKQNTFRIANIGAIVPDDIVAFLGHLENYLLSL